MKNRKTWNIFSKRYWTKENLFMTKEEKAEFKEEWQDLKEEWKDIKEEFKKDKAELDKEWKELKTELKEDFQEINEDFKSVMDDFSEVTDEAKEVEREFIETVKEKRKIGVGKAMWHLGCKAGRLGFKSMFIFAIAVIPMLFYDLPGLVVGIILALIILACIPTKKKIGEEMV